MSSTGIWIQQKPRIHCFSTQRGNSQSKRVKRPQRSNLATERCTSLAQIVRGQVIDFWNKVNWPQCQILNVWIHPSTNREYRTVRHNTGPSVSTWTACSKWGMSCRPLNPWPHMSYARNRRWDHQLKQFPTQPILSFLTLLSLSLSKRARRRKN